VSSFPAADGVCGYQSWLALTGVAAAAANVWGLVAEVGADDAVCTRSQKRHPKLGQVPFGAPAEAQWLIRSSWAAAAPRENNGHEDEVAVPARAVVPGGAKALIVTFVDG